jgi:galactokinase
MAVSSSPLQRLAARMDASAASGPPRAFFAPGRANLLGAHLDYNGGCVMPVALSKGTYAVVAPRADGMLVAASEQFPGERVELPLTALAPGRTRGWSAYLEGALWSAQQDWGPLPGIELQVAADLPMAKGLSSSASIECVVVRAVADLLGVRPGDDALIRVAHAAETRYVGVRCGILDQTAIFLGRANAVLHFDCTELTREHLPLDARAALVAVMDSGTARGLATSAFNQRVAESTRALAALQEALPGVACLRDVSRADFVRHGGRLPAVLQRRVRHVIDEQERTERGAAALRRGDLAEFGAMMSAAHVSLRDLYEVSTPELDALAAAAAAVPGCYGARLTGAGFGGCAVALVHPDARAEFDAHVPRAYRAACGRDTEVMWFTPAGGPCELPL